MRSYGQGREDKAHRGSRVRLLCSLPEDAAGRGLIRDQALKGLAALAPPDADPEDVARTIVRVVDAPFGRRPFRVHIDPANDGAEVVNAVADRMRRESLTEDRPGRAPQARRSLKRRLRRWVSPLPH